MSSTSFSVPKGMYVIPVAFLLVVAALGSYFTVDSGERAVVLRFGEIQNVVDQGLHFKMPLIDKVERVSVRTRAIQIGRVSAASRDLQMVTSEVVVPCHLEADAIGEIYTNQGFMRFEERIIVPNIQETVKKVCARFSAEELITRREEARNAIFETLRDALKIYGVIVEGVQLTNFDFSKQFNSAIEAKMTAEQDALRAKNDLERVKMEAKQKVEMASAQAQSRIALAEAEAKAIKMQTEVIKETGGKDYILLKALERWNGVMPTQLLLGSEVTPFVDLKK